MAQLEAEGEAVRDGAARDRGSRLRSILEGERFQVLMARSPAVLQLLGPGIERGGIARIDIERVFDRERSYVLDVAVRVRGTPEERAIPLVVQLVDGDTGDQLGRSLRRLRRTEPRQLEADDDSALAAIPQLGAVCRRPGFDKRIAGLGFLHRPHETPQRVLTFTGGSPVPAFELLAHRFEKRAVLRAQGPRGSVILKAYRPGLTHQADTAAWALALEKEHLFPSFLGEVNESDLTIWEDLGPADAGEWSIPGSGAVIAAGTALSRLHRTRAVSPPPHDVKDEIAALRRTASLAGIARPAAAPLLKAAAARAARSLGALGPAAPAVIHRDAHPGQFLSTAEGMRVIDLDTLSRGDAALDLGNYAAHLDLSGASGLIPALFDGYGAPQALRERARAWQTASLVRLAAICLLSTTRHEIGLRCLEGLAE